MSKLVTYYDDGVLTDHKSSHYIAPVGDTSEGAKIYFDVDPVPIPALQSPRTINRQKCARANVAGTITSGASIVYDFGSADTDMTIDIIIPFVSNTTKTALQNLYKIVYPIWYYHGHKNQFTKCSWADLKFTAYTGTNDDVHSCTMSLYAIGSQVATRDGT